MSRMRTGLWNMFEVLINGVKNMHPIFWFHNPFFSDSPYDKVPDIEANPQNYDIISFDVEPGDVIIHHVLTIHGARGNQSTDKMRRAISFRYCGDNVT